MRTRTEAAEPGLEAAPAQTGVPPAAVVAMMAGLAAAWTSAGSIGLVASPLVASLVWIEVAVALVALWPAPKQPPAAWYALGASVAILALATGWGTPEVVVLAVCLVLAALGAMQTGSAATAVRLTALAIAGFGLYRLACTSIPAVWFLADWLGRAVGWLAGSVLGLSLWVGPSCAGLDFRGLMVLLCAGWLVLTPGPRAARACYAAAAILGAQLLYLFILGHSQDLAAMLPDAPPPVRSEGELEQTPVWVWSESLRTALPWNLPLLAGLLQAAVAALMVRWGPPLPGPEEASRRLTLPLRESTGTGRLLRFGPPALGLLIAVLVVLCPFSSDLTGKKIVAYQPSLLDWNGPRFDLYGQDAAGTLGMLPVLIESLGGQFAFSDDLAEQDLAGADVLLLVHPDRPWTDPQRQRIWDFVRRGGSLLVAAETRIEEQGSVSTFNEILEPTTMRVRYDSAVSATRNWRYAIDRIGPPAVSGLSDRRDQFGILAGSSIWARWPARPVLVGRWGWSDPGSDAVMLGPGRWDPGERLGDLVLVAAERLGAGRVLVLGDATCLTNVIGVNAYEFSGRVLGYLAGRSDGPHAWWRQLLALAALAVLLVLIVHQAEPRRLAAAVVPLGCALVLCGAVNTWTSRVLPDDRRGQRNSLAYIGASHMEAHGGPTWADTGITGLTLTLMRSGGQPLLLPRMSAERLQRAAMLISIAPAKAFSASERQMIRQFVDQGGIFILTVGAEESQANAALLEELGFKVPYSPVGPNDPSPEPEPLGCIFGRYIDTDSLKADLMFYAAWPVESTKPDAVVRVRGNEGWPVIVTRAIGRGTVVVIGDSWFPLNKNLERSDGGPVQGGRHNAHFWRWFLDVLEHRTPWLPPASDATSTEAKKPAAEAQVPGPEAAKPPAKAEPAPFRMRPRGAPGRDSKPGREGTPGQEGTP